MTSRYAPYVVVYENGNVGPDTDGIREALDDGEILKVNAGDPWPKPLPKRTHYVLEVNDHGNISLFSRRNSKRSLWSFV